VVVYSDRSRRAWRHFRSHGEHSASRALSAIVEAKLASFGLKPGGLEAIFRELSTSAGNSRLDPVLCAFDMRDSLRDGDGEGCETILVSSSKLARLERVSRQVGRVGSELAHALELTGELLELGNPARELLEERPLTTGHPLEEFHSGGE